MVDGSDRQITSPDEPLVLAVISALINGEIAVNTSISWSTLFWHDMLTDSHTIYQSRGVAAAIVYNSAEPSWPYWLASWVQRNVTGMARTTSRFSREIHYGNRQLIKSVA